jgi:inosine-uridine nucleoside N-ribohydrolase
MQSQIKCLTKTTLVIALAFILSACSTQPVQTSQALPNSTLAQAATPITAESCVLIDTDYNLDDLMAIPVITANRQVKAIIVTEGYVLAPQGASALVRLISEPGSQPPYPVIIGASYPGTRDIKKWPWLADMRASMHRSNDLLSKPLTPVTTKDRNFTAEVHKALEECQSISILVIGAFTSFAQYSPGIRDRINMVVMQGRPRFSNISEKRRISFNCEYDLESCEIAFEQLKELQAVWVDVPRDATPPYSPTTWMVDALKDEGYPEVVKAALLSNQGNWRLELLTEGNESRLWDQLAALYMIYPEHFHQEIDHMEPTPPAAVIQHLWAENVNKNLNH